MALRKGVKSVTVHFEDGKIETFTGEHMRYIRANNYSYQPWKKWINHELYWTTPEGSYPQVEVQLDTEPPVG